MPEARAKGYDRDPQMLDAIEKMLANRVRKERRQAAAPELFPAEIETRPDRFPTLPPPLSAPRARRLEPKGGTTTVTSIGTN